MKLDIFENIIKKNDRNSPQDYACESESLLSPNHRDQPEKRCLMLYMPA